MQEELLFSCRAKLSWEPVVGVAGRKENRPLLQPLPLELRKHWGTHEFLYLPQSPIPWLGRDLFGKWDAQKLSQMGKHKFQHLNQKLLRQRFLCFRDQMRRKKSQGA